MHVSELMFVLDRADEGWVAIEEAVELRRPVAAREPVSYQADHARALYVYAIRAGERGLPEPALAAAEEAVAIRRPLAKRYPTLYSAALARALRAAADLLDGLDRADEATEFRDEAAEVRS